MSNTERGTCKPVKHSDMCVHCLMLMVLCVFFRGSWWVKGSSCSRRRSLWRSRTLAFCPAVKSAGCSSSSRSSSSASSYGKARPHQDISLKRASRWACSLASQLLKHTVCSYLSTNAKPNKLLGNTKKCVGQSYQSTKITCSFLLYEDNLVVSITGKIYLKSTFTHPHGNKHV